MSDKDKPANPFGRGERTIIRPNPGGRLPQRRPSRRIRRPRPPPRPRAAVPPTRPTPPASPVSACPALSAATAAPIRRAARRQLPRSPLRSGAIDAAPRTGFQHRRAGAAPELPRSPPLRVDELVAPNANPIMRAAGPLLLLLGRLRVALMRASFASLMEQVADAVKFFETDIRSAGISEQQANTAKYILCATADDIVQHIPTEDRHVWTQYSMLSRFFGERVGGVRFFEILDRLKLDPAGQLSGARAAARLPRARLPGHASHLAGGLASAAADPAQSLRNAAPGSPEGRCAICRRTGSGQAAGRSPAVACRVPAWVVAAVVAALLFGCYFALRGVAVEPGREAAAQVALALHPGRSDRTEAPRHRAAAAAAAAAAAGPHHAAAAHPQRAGGRKDRLRDDRGSDRELHRHPGLRPRPVRVRAGDGARRVQADRGARRRDARQGAGHIKVVGHTDNTPISTVALPVEFRTLGRARQGGRGRAQARALPSPSRVDDRRQGAGRADRHQRDAGGARQEPARRNLHRAQRIADTSRSDRGKRCFARQIVRIVLYGIGLGSLAAVVYFAGPLIAFGDWRPLENPIVRDIVILLLVAGVAGVGGFAFYRRRKGAKEIADGISGDERDGQRRARPQGADEGRAGDAEDRERRQVRLSLRSALVRHHRSARRRQDHGAGQFRPEISARRAARRRRRSRASAARAIATGGSPKRRC